MALMDAARGRVSRHTPEAASITSGRPRTRRKAAVELVATFLLLMGIAIGILVLRFALVLMNGVLQ